MGAPLSGLLANIYVEYIENWALNSDLACEWLKLLLFQLTSIFKPIIYVLLFYLFFEIAHMHISP